MDTLYPHCAGLDVHKDSVVVCVRHQEAGKRVRQEVRTFSTLTRPLLELADWLAEEKVTHVAMESTGVYWRPVYAVLEGRFELLLVNAQHLKQVPGRKTDVKDCQWIARLLQHGLLRGSFVPPPEQRELRELTRQRVQLVQERARIANRLQKVLEDANIKLGSVARDVLGVSGRAILAALIESKSSPAEMAQLARGRLRQKIEALQLALEGRVTEHHRFLIQLLLDHVTHLEELIGKLECRIEEVLGPFAQAVESVATIPGINRCAAQAIIAETGIDMDRFATPGHLASWTGICPGNDISAGKRRSGRITKGNVWLKRVLVQAAWAASHTKTTYLGTYYRRMAARRGSKRALVALAHTMLTIIYHLLKKRQCYQELGADYFDRRDSDRLTRRLVQRLEKLGHEVKLAPKADAA